MDSLLLGTVPTLQSWRILRKMLHQRHAMIAMLPATMTAYVPNPKVRFRVCSEPGYVKVKERPAG